MERITNGELMIIKYETGTVAKTPCPNGKNCCVGSGACCSCSHHIKDDEARLEVHCNYEKEAISAKAQT